MNLPIRRPRQHWLYIYKKKKGEILNIYFYLYIFRHLRVRVDFHRWMDTGAKSPPTSPELIKARRGKA